MPSATITRQRHVSRLIANGVDPSDAIHASTVSARTARHEWSEWNSTDPGVLEGCRVEHAKARVAMAHQFSMADKAEAIY